MKKIYTAIMAAILLLSTLFTALGASAQAGPGAHTNETRTVTLHKLLMSKSELDAFTTPEAYDGTQTLDQLKRLTGKNDLQEIAGVYFAWQNSRGEWINDQGQVVTSVEEALGAQTGATGAEFNTSGLPAGDYKIVEVDSKTDYVDDVTKAILADSKAVPVTIRLPLLKADGTFADHAHVYPKNTQEAPTLEKKVEGLDEVDATLGRELTYTVTSTIKAGSRYKTLAYKDTMSNGLTMVPGVTIAAQNVTLQDTADYTLTQDDRGFSLVLTDAGLKKVSDITNPVGDNNGEDVTFTITYKAYVNANAVKREKNTVKVDYSNVPSQEVTPVQVTPSPEGDLAVTKEWQANDGGGIAAPNDQTLTYTLYKAGAAVATVQLDNASVNGSVINLGNGLTFTVTGAFSGTFKGLQAGETDYTISERISGYTPSYDAAAGTVTVTNKKNKTPEIVNPADAFVNLNNARFVKVDSQNNERLQTAQFVVKNTANGQFLAFESAADQSVQQQDLVEKKEALDQAVKAYNALAADKQTPQEKAKVDAAQTAYNTAYAAAKITYTYTANQNAANVVTLTSNDQGQFEIAGLEAGDYELIETVAPKGYALNTGAISFTAGDTTGIAYIDSSGQNDAKTVTNVKLSIPQTGGMGTIIFAVAGISLMAVAYYGFMKNNRNKEA
ncbi:MULTISPECIES: isopeptide-forming domain-containing fimbrial protein [unclassified Streptococcus]|uniref:isopeptide-forming domain-containing fimbrial protein n=1 Tax=unclassified Streptococcus TaxID=2608887 RepID=UPI00359E65E0